MLPDDIASLQKRLFEGANVTLPRIYDRKGSQREEVKRFQHLVKAWTHVKRTPAAAAPTGSKPTALTAPSVLLESESPQAELRVLTNETVPPSPNGRRYGVRGRDSLQQLTPSKLHKSGKQVKLGRTFTSKFRGVHQTFPTRRWEAQFRRNGKPTSLGCFDHEEEAAGSYDRMMIWCHLHKELPCKHGITNFDMKEYEADYDYLMAATQEDLIESLRSEGRRQAATRQLRSKQDRQGLPATQFQDRMAHIAMATMAVPHKEPTLMDAATMLPGVSLLPGVSAPATRFVKTEAESGAVSAEAAAMPGAEATGTALSEAAGTMPAEAAGTVPAEATGLVPVVQAAAVPAEAQATGTVPAEAAAVPNTAVAMDATTAINAAAVPETAAVPEAAAAPEAAAKPVASAAPDAAVATVQEAPAAGESDVDPSEPMEASPVVKSEVEPMSKN